MLVLKACSFNDTLSARMISEQVDMPAVPTPCNARPSIKIGQTGAAAHRIPPIVMITTASSSAAKRPNTSASWPKTGTKAVSVSVKAVPIQLSWFKVSVMDSVGDIVEVRAMHTEVRCDERLRCCDDGQVHACCVEAREQEEKKLPSSTVSCPAYFAGEPDGV